MRPVLDVRQSFYGTTLAADHFFDGQVTIGNATGWRWSFLGVDMGQVAAPLRHVLPLIAPIWSDVEAEPVHAFPDQELQAHTLFEHEGDEWFVHPPPGWTATSGGAPIESGSAVTGPVELTRGAVRYTAAVVDAPPPAPRAQAEADPPLLATLGTLAACAGLFALTVAFAPPPAQVDLLEDPSALKEIVVRMPPPPPAPVVEQPVAKNTGGTGSAAPTESPAPDAGATRSDREVATSAGLFNAPDLLSDLGGGLGDLAGIASNLRGFAGSPGPAIGSLGGRGSSLEGGGGGIGTNGPIGRIGGNGTEHAYASGPGKRPGAIASVRTGTSTLVGSLKRSEIESVIHQNLNSIQYCYRRRLQRDPGLSGKLVVKFTVGKDGSVSSASVKSSSLTDAAVGSCVVDRFKRMDFPAPRGGGMVLVSYPFHFAPG